MRVLLLLAGLTAALPAVGQQPVSEAVLPLGDGELVWRAGEGLTLRYRDQRLLLPGGSDLVLHDPGWTTQYWNSSTRPPAVQLRREGQRHVLTLVYDGGGMTATQTISTQPDGRFRIGWRMRQDGWQPAHLQLAVAKPAEAFLAGAQYEATAGGKPASGTIPAVFDPQRRQPLAGVTAVTFRSLFGTLTLTASEALAVYDYEKRNGAFWLGFDRPLPRGEEQTFSVEGELRAPIFEVGGVVVVGLQVPDRLAEGRVRAGLSLQRAGTAPARLQLALEARRGEGAPARQVVEVPAGAGTRTVELSLPAREPGPYRVRLMLVDTASGRELLRTPEMPVAVLPPMSVVPSLSFFSGEDAGSLVVRLRPETPAGLRFEATGGGLRIEGRPAPGARTLLPFDASRLPEGETPLNCRLIDGERLVAETVAILRRLPPKANQVKIDQISRGLLVDGLPLLPFGLYAKWPALDVAEEEAPYGFTHLAPYRGQASFITDDAGRSAVVAALDRYAALGIKIHYDVRHLTTAEDTEGKYARLKTEIEAVRDHPALLCYYLADEPELQGIPPERLAKAYRFIRELDPYHPCTQVFANRDKAPDYLGGMDIIMTDPYPIPNRPVTEVAQAADRLDASTGQSLPLWIVPQMFGGGEWWAREPSPQEERVMTYLSLIHGATGIQYFIRERAHVRPLPLLLNEVRALAAEAAELTPALLSPLPRPAVRANSAEVHAAAWRTAEAVYVLAANTANRPLPLELTVADAPAGLAEVLFEHRQATVSDGCVSDMIDAFGTRAYRLALVPEEDSGLIAGNLSRNASFEEHHVPGSPDGYYLGGQPDPGAQVRVDPRLAVHGRHSLRVVVPADGKGYSLSPFPVRLKAGQEYEISLHARGLSPGGKLSVSLGELTPKQAEFTLTTEWQRFSVRARATKDNPRGTISYRLATAGTAWIDLWQVVPVNP